MKSLVQEAVSIAKAIDAAWIHAGKPENFSIKILEYPEKNFFGFTKKSAKIAFFFEEAKQQAVKQSTNKQPYKQQQQRVAHTQQQAQPQQQRQPQKSTPAPKSTSSMSSSANISAHAPIKEEKHIIQAPTMQPKQSIEQQRTIKQPEKTMQQTHTTVQSHEEQKRAILWNNEHIETVQAWVKKMLTFMNRADVPFTVEQEELIIKISFHEPLIGVNSESSQEKKLFTHLSLLLMTILKKQYRSAFRGHRILFTHKQ